MRSSLLSSSCLVLVALMLLSGSSQVDAIQVAQSANGGKISLPHTLNLKKKPSVFTPTKDGKGFGSRQGMSWKEAGRTIPMSGGTLSTGGFFTEITVGTANGGAGVKFYTIVDTGSSNTNIPGSNCGSNCGSAPNVYNASASATARPLKCNSAMCQNCLPTKVGNASVPTGHQDANTCVYGQPVCSATDDQCEFRVSYGGSGTSTQGVTYRDRACLGEVCGDDVYLGAFTNQYPTGTQSTGILGLAFPHNSCTPNCQPTILDVLADKQVITQEQNMFGMCLTPATGGFIDLGALNADRYNATEMQYTKVVQERWYNVEVKGMKVNGTMLDAPAFLYNIVNDGIGAFADSGTTVVLVSPVVYSVLSTVMTSQFAHLSSVSSLFNGGTGFLTDAQVAEYPEMSFVLAGMDGKPDFEIKMNGKQYLLGEAGVYSLGIAGVPSIGAIFGDVIMQNYYINFDRYGRRLGFAPLTPGSC